MRHTNERLVGPRALTRQRLRLSRLDWDRKCWLSSQDIIIGHVEAVILAMHCMVSLLSRCRVSSIVMYCIRLVAMRGNAWYAQYFAQVSNCPSESAKFSIFMDFLPSLFIYCAQLFISCQSFCYLSTLTQMKCAFISHICWHFIYFHFIFIVMRTDKCV